MLTLLIWKELFDHLRSLRFAVAGVVFLLIFLLSAAVRTGNYRKAVETYTFNRSLHKDQLLRHAEITGIESLSQGFTVDRPPNPLNLLIRGVISPFTESVRVGVGKKLGFAEGEGENALSELFPGLDFAFIVGVIGSLLAMSFSYDAVCGEQESGVLKLIMSFSLSRDRLLLGKWLGGYLALIAPLVMAFLAGLAVIGLFSGVEIRADFVLSVVGLSGVALLYLGAMFSLGIFVSCRVRNAATSITVLLLIWLVFIWAIPNTAPTVSGLLLPVPTRQSVEREKEKIQKERSRQVGELVRAEQRRTGKSWYPDNEEFNARKAGVEQRAQEALQKVEERYMAKAQAQSRLSSVVAQLSPFSSFKLAAVDLAATGIEQERRFVAALNRYSDIWGEYDKEKMGNGRLYTFNLVGLSHTDRPLRDFSDYPRFEFEYMPFAERLNQAYFDVALLVVWNVVFFLLAYVSFLRYEIR